MACTTGACLQSGAPGHSGWAYHRWVHQWYRPGHSGYWRGPASDAEWVRPAVCAVVLTRRGRIRRLYPGDEGVGEGNSADVDHILSPARRGDSALPAVTFD